LTLAIVGGLASSGATPAAAQDSPSKSESSEADARARRHFETGRDYFKSLRYEDAIREFTEAYELSGRPQLLLNIAIAQERVQRYGEAADTLEQYLEVASEVPDRSQIEDRIERLRRRAEELAAGKAPEPGTQVSQKDAGKALPDKQGPSGAEPAPGGLGALRWSGVAAFGVAAAAGAAALGTGVRSDAIHGDLQDACGPDRTCPPGRSGDIDRGRALSRTSTAMTFVAAAAAAGGAVLWFVGSGSEERQGVAVRVGPGRLGLRGSF
jgi:hypothetical protein